MNQKKSLLILALALVVLVGGAWFLYGRLAQGAEHDQLAVQTTPPPEGTAPQTAGPAGEGTQPPQPDLAPDFTVYDGEGREIKLSDFRGKPVVINFWASWCGPCRSELPDFDAAFRELGGEIHFLMVNMTGGRETQESAQALIRAEGYSFPAYYDLKQDAAYTYGVYSLPTTLFLDSEGRGIAQATGAIDRATLQRGIDMILPG